MGLGIDPRFARGHRRSGVTLPCQLGDGLAFRHVPPCLREHVAFAQRPVLADRIEPRAHRRILRAGQGNVYAAYPRRFARVDFNVHHAAVLARFDPAGYPRREVAAGREDLDRLRARLFSQLFQQFRRDGVVALPTQQIKVLLQYAVER